MIEGTYEFMACPIGKDSCPDQPGLDPSLTLWTIPESPGEWPWS